MIVYDLDSGRRMDRYDEIEDRRGGRQRRSDGTYMGHDGYGPYDRYGEHPYRKMREMEDNYRHDGMGRYPEDTRRYHEDDGMYRRRVGYRTYPEDRYDGDDYDRYYGDEPMMVRRRPNRFY